MSSTTSTTGWRDIAAAIGMFVLGFVVLAGLVHQGLRDPFHLHADVRSEKLALLKQWSGTVYTASFGSSHVHEGFDPRIFDQEMAGTPGQTRTVNLAIEGGSQSEQRLTALEFLRSMKPPPPSGAPSAPRTCMVMLELAAGANFSSDFLVHPRTINIYNWDTAKFVMTLTSPQMSRAQRIGRVGFAFVAMGMHYMNLGMLSSRIFQPPLDTQMIHDQTSDDRRGLLVMDKPLANIEKMTKMIAESPKQPTVTQGTILPGNRELVDELQAASPVSNLQIAYVVIPKVSNLEEQTNYPDSLETAHGLVPILNLARPDLYPQVYKPTLWYDEAHLNQEGAQLMTKLLAEDLKRWYAAHGQPVGCGR